MFFGFIVYAVLCMIISFSLLATFGPCGIHVRQFGWFMGLVAAMLNVFQWSPQIYKTYKSKSKGSFSLIMLLIQAPGSFILVYFLVIVSKENISVWFSTLSAGIQQFILLTLILRYDYWPNKIVIIDDEETQSLVNSTKKKSVLFKKWRNLFKNPCGNFMYACKNCKNCKIFKNPFNYTGVWLYKNVRYCFAFIFTRILLSIRDIIWFYGAVI